MEKTYYIGEKLRLELFRIKMSQEVFGDRTGHSQATISFIVTNRRGVTWEEIQQFARVLGISPQQLIE